MISASDRSLAVELIDEARAAGARLQPACKILNISERTYQRWTKEGDVAEDKRPNAKRPIPKNKLLLSMKIPQKRERKSTTFG